MVVRLALIIEEAFYCIRANSWHHGLKKSCWAEWVYAVYWARPILIAKDLVGFLPAHCWVFLQKLAVFFIPHTLKFLIISVFFYLLLDSFALNTFFILVYVASYFSVVFKGRSVYPCGGWCAAPVTADKSYCYTKVFGKLSSKEKADCTPCPWIILWSLRPCGIVFAFIEHFVKSATLLSVIKSYVAIRGEVFEDFFAALCVLKFKLHIWLAAAEPHFAYHDTAEFFLCTAVWNCHFVLSACTHWREDGCPPAVADLRLDWHTVKSNCDGSFLVPKSPDCYVLVTLEHHIVWKNICYF